MNEAAADAFNLMSGQGWGESFVPNQNIWLSTYPGEKHGLVEWISRFWNIMMTLSLDRQYVEYSEED